MGLLVTCPLGAALGDVAIDACPESVGQVQKVLFQRIESVAGTANEMTILTANPNLKATWAPLLAAADGTRVVQSPYVGGPVTEPGAARTFGGGNETLGGIPIVIGTDPTTFTANVLQSAQKTIKALKTYMSETVGVFLIDEFGRIIGLTDDSDSPLTFKPIPISSLFIGDKKLGGYEGVDLNVISWSFYPNWSDNLHIVTPSDFNALTEMVSA